MREFVLYTAARFGVFFVLLAVCLGVAWLLDPGYDSVPVFVPVVVAALLSTVASTYLLRGMRERFAESIQQRADRMSQRFEEMRAKEDTD